MLIWQCTIYIHGETDGVYEESYIATLPFPPTPGLYITIDDQDFLVLSVKFVTSPPEIQLLCERREKEV